MATLLISRVAISANVSVAFIRNRDVGAFIGLDLRVPLHERLYIHAMGVKSIVRYFGHPIFPGTKWGVKLPPRAPKTLRGKSSNAQARWGGSRNEERIFAPQGGFSAQVRVPPGRRRPRQQGSEPGHRAVLSHSQ